MWDGRLIPTCKKVLMVTFKIITMIESVAGLPGYISRLLWQHLMQDIGGKIKLAGPKKCKVNEKELEDE